MHHLFLILSSAFYVLIFITENKKNTDRKEQIDDFCQKCLLAFPKFENGTNVLRA